MINNRSSSNLFRRTPSDSTTSSSSRSSRSNASSRTSSGTSLQSGDSAESKASNMKSAAKLIAQGMGNAMGGAFLQGASRRMTNMMSNQQHGTFKDKEFADTKTGKRASAIEDKGEAQQSLGKAQLKMGFAKLRGKSGALHQERVEDAKLDRADQKAKLKDMANARAEARATDKQYKASRSARAIEKYDDYGS